MSLSQASRRLPLYLLAALTLAALMLSPWPQTLRTVLGSEAGVVEVLTVFAALGGSVVAAGIALRTGRSRQPAAALWFGMFAIGLFFLAGEEASWGQHWLRFATPEEWAAHNLQGETNLHNASLATERVPKTLFSLGVLLTGVIWPLVHRRTGRLHPPAPGLSLVWPDPRLATAALIAFALRLVERAWVWLDLEDGALRPWYVTEKESIELFMTLFVLFHLMQVWERVRPGDLPNARAAPISVE